MKKTIVVLLIALLVVANLGQVYAWVPSALEVVDTNSAGIKGNNFAWEPEISLDGRYITFISSATNLAPNDTNGRADGFRKDMLTGEVVMLDVDNSGNQALDGVVESRKIKLSSDGSKVLFVTGSALVPEDTNGLADIYLRDISEATTIRVSVGDTGQQPNVHTDWGLISGDSTTIIFQSYATNLVDGATTYTKRTYLRDLVNSTTEIITLPGQGETIVWGVSDNGRSIVYSDHYTKQISENSTTIFSDIFAYDRLIGSATQVNVSSDGQLANGSSSNPSITSDGRYVTFNSVADNLVANDNNQAWDIFVHDMITGETEIVSITSGGQQSNSSSYNSQISADGRYVIFNSFATNLAPDPQPINTLGVYVRDRLSNRTERTNPDWMNDTFGGGQAISSDGSYIALAATYAPNPSNNWTVLRRSICSVFSTCVNTPAGQNVNVNLPPLNLTFSQVNTGGTTTAATSSSGTQPPTGFKLGSPPTYYSVSTTALFTGTVEICINYDESTIQGSESQLKLMHFDPAVGWVDTTSSLDTANNVICGLTTSFSDFTIMTEPNIQDLIDRVKQMNLQQGIENSLDAKLQRVQEALNAQSNNDATTATNALQAFINEVEAQRGVKLTSAQADGLQSFGDNLIKIINGQKTF